LSYYPCVPPIAIHAHGCNIGDGFYRQKPTKEFIFIDSN
jgi:hypothetical protein